MLEACSALSVSGTDAEPLLLSFSLLVTVGVSVMFLGSAVVNSVGDVAGTFWVFWGNVASVAGAVEAVAWLTADGFCCSFFDFCCFGFVSEIPVAILGFDASTDCDSFAESEAGVGDCSSSCSFVGVGGCCLVWERLFDGFSIEGICGVDTGFGVESFDVDFPVDAGLGEAAVVNLELSCLLAPSTTSPSPKVPLLLRAFPFVLAEDDGAIIFKLVPGVDLLLVLLILLGVPIDFLLANFGDTRVLDFAGRTNLPLGVAREVFEGGDEGNRFFVVLPPGMFFATEFVLAVLLLLPVTFEAIGVIDAILMLMFDRKDCCCCGGC